MNEIIRRFMRQEDVGKFAANVAAAEKNVRESLLRVRQKGYYPPAGRYGEDLYAAAKRCGEHTINESYARGIAEGTAAGAGIAVSFKEMREPEENFAEQKAVLQEEGFLLDREDREMLERAVADFYAALRESAHGYYLAGLRLGIAVGELLAEHSAK